MKNVVSTVLLVLVGQLALAESHGSVRRANIQFAEAVEYAQNEARSTYRVMGINRFKSCDEGTVFEIALGAMEYSGQEAIQLKKYILVPEISDFDENQQKPREVSSLTNCLPTRGM